MSTDGGDDFDGSGDGTDGAPGDVGGGVGDGAGYGDGDAGVGYAGTAGDGGTVDGGDGDVAGFASTAATTWDAGSYADTGDGASGDGGPTGATGTGATDAAGLGGLGASAEPQAGTRWNFFCPGHFQSYREGRDHEDHPNEYGPPRTVKYIAEQDMAGHVSQWPSHASIAVVEEAS